MKMLVPDLIANFAGQYGGGKKFSDIPQDERHHTYGYGFLNRHVGDKGQL
jgi:hypothetical protein